MKINIGAGDWRQSGWTNLDFFTEHYRNEVVGNIDIQHDLSSMTRIPVENGAGGLIYTSHTIEHLMPEHVRKLFSEAFRIMAPGGVIRVTCPDAELYHHAYTVRDEAFFPYPDLLGKFDLEQIFLYEIASMCSEVQENCAHPRLPSVYVRKVVESKPMAAALDTLCSHVDYRANKVIVNHVSWWTADKVVSALNAAGFRAYRSGWGQSRVPEMRDMAKFDTVIPTKSLFVEAIKR